MMTRIVFYTTVAVGLIICVIKGYVPFIIPTALGIAALFITAITYIKSRREKKENERNNRTSEPRGLPYK